jgi:hypothetical protein
MYELITIEAVETMNKERGGEQKGHWLDTRIATPRMIFQCLQEELLV